MVKPGDDVVAGLRLIDTPGHTQGHVSLELSGGDGVIVGGDVLTHPLISFGHPDWRPTADHVPDQAVATRRKLLDRLATDRTKLIGFHLPYPGIGIVERKDLRLPLCGCSLIRRGDRHCDQRAGDRKPGSRYADTWLTAAIEDKSGDWRHDTAKDSGDVTCGREASGVCTFRTRAEDEPGDGDEQRCER